jgi:hypothetical protein
MRSWGGSREVRGASLDEHRCWPFGPDWQASWPVSPPLAGRGGVLVGVAGLEQVAEVGLRPFAAGGHWC